MRLRERRKEIERAGGAIVAISADAPEDAAKLEKKLGEDDEGPLGFPLLSDVGCRAAKAFGVHHVESDIAIPSVFVIGRDGKVAWRHVGETMADRPPEDEIIGALQRAASGKAK